MDDIHVLVCRNLHVDQRIIGPLFQRMEVVYPDQLHSFRPFSYLMMTKMQNDGLIRLIANDH